MAVAPEMEQYLVAFLVEAKEELLQLKTCLERLRREGAKLAIVEEAARATANIKSAAATMGFQQARDLAHATLDMLNAWRRGGVKNPGMSLDLLSLAYQRLMVYIEMLREGRGPEPVVSDLAIQLRALVTNEAENPWPEAESPSPKEQSEQRFIVKLVLENPCVHPVGRFLVCQGYLLNLGRVLTSDSPPDTNDTQEDLVLRFLISTSRTAQGLKQAIETIPHLHKVEISPATPEMDTLPPLLQERKRSTLQDWWIRVEATSLDLLAEIQEELVQIRSGYRALEQELHKIHPALAFRFARLGDRSEYPLRQLAEAIGQFRRVPAELLLTKLTRYTQEYAKIQEKEVEIRSVGADNLLFIEQAEALLLPAQQCLELIISESLLKPAGRREMGKPGANRVEFKVVAQDEKTVISVSDDGLGLNLEREFNPGGRFYELKRKLETGGTVMDGQSWPGQGTLLNLEITPPGIQQDVLAFEIGAEWYALPLGVVFEARRIVEENIVHIDGRNYLSQGRELIPVFDLPAVLGKQAGGKGGFWLMVKSGEEVIAYKVPSVAGARQVMLRPNQAAMHFPGLKGACTDSGGRIYLLLEPEELLKLASFKPSLNQSSDRRARA